MVPAPMQLLQEVLGVGDPDHLLDVTARDGIAGMARLGDRRKDLLGRLFDVEPDNGLPWDHDGAHGPVADAQHTLDHFPLLGMEHAGRGAFGDQGLHLLLGDHALGGGLEAKQGHHGLRAGAQEPHDRRTG